MNKPVGGRGHKAPYETTHIRIPEPIKPDVQKLIEAYRSEVMEGEKLVSDHKLDLEEAKMLARKLLRSKTSKIETITKLLTGIYGEDISASDLLK